MTETQYIERLRQALLKRDPPALEEELRICDAYVKQLYQQNLPVLFNGEHVAEVLQIQQRNIICYHVFGISQIGKERRITAPSRSLKVRQRWILENILSKESVSPYAHGFERDHSIMTNAMVHMGNEYVLCIDVKDFFSSIQIPSVRNVFRGLGYSSSAAEALAQLCCYQGALPQGAPTSPRLANLICKELDEKLGEMAEQNHAVYSRYADDITFSADVPVEQLLPEIEEYLKKYGFQLNRAKTEMYQPGEVKRITGLIVHHDRIRVPKQFKRELKKAIHFCLKYGVQNHLESTKSSHMIHYREYLYGKAYYVHMIEPEEGKRFLESLDQIVWPLYMLDDKE